MENYLVIDAFGVMVLLMVGIDFAILQEQRTMFGKNDDLNKN